MTRRTFSPTDPSRIQTTLTAWADAAKRVAAEKEVPLIDLHARSIELCEDLGPERTGELDPLKPDGTPDTTHLGPAGSALFARLVFDDLKRLVPELAPYLREPGDDAAKPAPRGTGSEEGVVSP